MTRSCLRSFAWISSKGANDHKSLGVRRDEPQVLRGIVFVVVGLDDFQLRRGQHDNVNLALLRRKVGHRVKDLSGGSTKRQGEELVGFDIRVQPQTALRKIERANSLHHRRVRKRHELGAGRAGGKRAVWPGFAKSKIRA